MEIRKGIPVSAGYAIARALVLDSERYRIRKRTIGRGDVGPEVRRFEGAVRKSREDLLELKQRWSTRSGDRLGELFDSHILVFEDKRILEEITKRIEEDRFTPEYAVSRVFRKYVKLFLELDDGYFRQRVSDLHDVERRLLRNLLGKKRETLAKLQEQVIVIAQDLTPSQTASLDRSKVVGFATDAGGVTSHTAIVAKALDIPAVVGLRTITTDVSGGDRVIIDGNRGHVIINPDDETLKKYRALERTFASFEAKLNAELKDLPASTKDGATVKLYANIEFPSEIPFALDHGAEGVGLFRSEFLYRGGKEPTEAQHIEAYRQATDALRGRPLVVRTFDLGGDKQFMKDTEAEPNPILGCRSIRHSLRHLDQFRVQLRGILKASAQGDIRILFPMISSVEEAVAARMQVEETKELLARDRIPFNPKVPVGIMIEVPSAALVADLLAPHVDFFSVGTNDLVQYTLAVDRVNERIADLYQPAHPAMFRLLRGIVEAGRNAKIPVSVCGEMAGDPAFTLFLLGLGVTEFSISPGLIPEIKKIVRSVSLEDARAVVEKANGFSRAGEAAAFLREKALSIMPEAF